MFQKKPKSKKNRSPSVHTLISDSTIIRGDLAFLGGCHIDGKVEGNVEAEVDSEAVLCISDNGLVEGHVVVPQLILHGTVHGDVSVAHRLELGATAKVVGNVYYNLLEMAMGAEINGKLIHQDKEADQHAIAEQLTDVIPLTIGKKG